MKIALTLIFTFSISILKAQDTAKIAQINALVAQINNSTLPIQHDTLNQNYPDLGLKITTYLTSIVNKGELLKYVNHVNTTRVENGQTRQITTSSSFYYQHNELIKVEEYGAEGDKKFGADWYYSEDKPLYYTMKTEKAADRAAFLLTLAKGMLEKMIK